MVLQQPGVIKNSNTFLGLINPRNVLEFLITPGCCKTMSCLKATVLHIETAWGEIIFFSQLREENYCSLRLLPHQAPPVRPSRALVGARPKAWPNFLSPSKVIENLDPFWASINSCSTAIDGCSERMKDTPKQLQNYFRPKVWNNFEHVWAYLSRALRALPPKSPSDVGWEGP